MISTPSACIVAEKEKVAKVVLMPGDPLRAKYIAEKYLENPELFNTVRNMYGYTGTYKGKRISVMGSGMGIPSMTLYAHELYNFFDVDSIIRVGSAGALRDQIPFGGSAVRLRGAFRWSVRFSGCFCPCPAPALPRSGCFWQTAPSTWRERNGGRRSCGERPFQRPCPP